MAAASSAMLGTIWLYSQGWSSNLIHCYFQSTFGFIGPGCGLTRSLVALSQGQWQLSMSYHLFGPFIGLGLVGLLLWNLVSLPTGKLLWPQHFTRTQSLLLSGLAIGFTLSFLGYYGLRLAARYSSDSLPAVLTQLSLWDFLVYSSNLL